MKKLWKLFKFNEIFAVNKIFNISNKFSIKILSFLSFSICNLSPSDDLIPYPLTLSQNCPNFPF